MKQHPSHIIAEDAYCSLGHCDRCRLTLGRHWLWFYLSTAILVEINPRGKVGPWSAIIMQELSERELHTIYPYV